MTIKENYQQKFGLTEADWDAIGAIGVPIAKDNFMTYYNEHKDPTKLATACTFEGFMAGMTFMEARMKAALAANVLNKPQQEG